MTVTEVRRLWDGEEIVIEIADELSPGHWDAARDVPLVRRNEVMSENAQSPSETGGAAAADIPRSR